MIPEASVEYAVGHPLVMIASDGVTYVNGRAHPRGAGTYARVLGRYVREKKVLTLMEAIRKMTLMRDKGRIRTGPGLGRIRARAGEWDVRGSERKAGGRGRPWPADSPAASATVSR